MSEPLPRSQPAVPADALLHPVVLAAIVVLLVNDHIMKAAWPGLITGKLSDFAGLLFFPLLLQAGWEVATQVLRRPCVASPTVLLVATIVSGVAFSAIQVVPAASDAYRGGLGFLQWLLAGMQGTPGRVMLAPDPTDLAALPMLAISYAIGLRRSGSPANRPDRVRLPARRTA